MVRKALLEKQPSANKPNERSQAALQAPSSSVAATTDGLESWLRLHGLFPSINGQRGRESPFPLQSSSSSPPRCRREEEEEEGFTHVCVIGSRVCVAHDSAVFVGDDMLRGVYAYLHPFYPAASVCLCAFVNHRDSACLPYIDIISCCQIRRRRHGGHNGGGGGSEPAADSLWRRLLLGEGGEEEALAEAAEKGEGGEEGEGPAVVDTGDMVVKALRCVVVLCVCMWF